MKKKPEIDIDDLLIRLNLADLAAESSEGSSDRSRFLVMRIRSAEIQIHPNDHPPPHFHVRVNDDTAVYEIATLELRKGSIPRHLAKAVMEWAQENRGALRRAWERSRPTTVQANNQ
jgi:hypothetical protein